MHSPSEPPPPQEDNPGSRSEGESALSRESKARGSRQRIGVAFVLVSGVSFGAIPLLARISFASGADAITALFARFSLAAACLLVLMLTRRSRRPSRKQVAALLALGGIVYVGQSLTYFLAMQHMAASVAALVIYIYPAIVAVFSTVFLRYPLTRLKAAAVGLSVLGCGLTVGRLGDAGVVGLSLALTSALLYAAYVLLATRLAGRVGAVASTGVMLSGTAFSYGAMVALLGAHWPQTPAGWWALLALALLSTVIAVLLFIAGAQRVGPVTASTVATVEPLCAVLLSFLFLGEMFTLIQAVGGVLIFVAVLIIAQP